MATYHWTEQSTADFLYRIGADYVRQIDRAMQETGTNQSLLAQQLGVTEGRVSQVLNNPGNLTLRKVIDYARALGKKVSIVAYEDNDPENRNGPINSEIFLTCWEHAGRPRDFFELTEQHDFSRNAAPPHLGQVPVEAKVCMEMAEITLGARQIRESKKYPWALGGLASPVAQGAEGYEAAFSSGRKIDMAR